MEVSDLAKSLLDAFDNSNEGLAIWNKDDTLVGFNQKYSKIFKRNMSIEARPGLEFISSYKEALKRPGSILNEKDIEERLSLRQKARKDKKPIIREFLLDGIWFKIKETPSNDGIIVTLITDITESKKNSEMQERLSDAIESIPSHVMFWDKNEKLVKANSLAIDENKQEGIKLKEGMHYSDFLTQQFNNNLYNTPENFDLKKFIEKRIKERSGLDSKSTKVKYKNGKTVIRTENKLADGGMLTILNDVSELERKEERETLLKDSLDNLSYGVQLWSSDKKLLTFNKAVERTIGFKPAIGMSFEEYFTKQVQNNFFDLEEKDKPAWIQKGLKYFDTFTEETNTTYRQPGGTYVLLNDKRLQDGSVLQIISDISYLKKQEKDLRRLTEAIDTMSNGVILWSADHKLIFANERMREIQKSFGFEFVPGVSRAAMLENQVEKGYSGLPEGMTVNGWIKESVELMKKEKDGIRQEMEIRGDHTLVSAQILEDGSYIQSYTDITDLKNKEIELNRIYNGIDVISNATILWDANDRVAFCNKEAIRVQKEFGFDIGIGTHRTELIKNSIKIGLFELPPNQTVEEYLENSRKTLRSSDGGITIELGNWIANTVGFEDGSYIQSYTDISEIKNKQKEMERLSDAIDMMPSGIIIWDKDQKLFFANKLAKDVQKEVGFNLEKGASRADMIKNSLDMGAFDLPDDASVAEYLKSTKQLMKENKEGFSREVSIGGRDWLSTNVGLKDDDFLQSYADITALKKQQNDLDRIKRAVDTSASALMLWNKQDELVFANKFIRDFAERIGFELIPGTKRIDWLRHQFRETAIYTKEKSAEEYAQRTKSDMDNSVDGTNFEFSFKGEDGKESHAIQSALRLDDGDWVQSITDVTQIKKQQEELKRLSDGIEKLANPIFIWDAENKLFFFNQAASKTNRDFWGIELEKNMPRESLLTQLDSKGLLTKPDGMSIQEYMGYQKGRMVESKEGITIESRLGEDVTLLANSRMLEDGSYIQNFTDISDIKKHEEMLEVQKERYSEVLGNLNAIVFTTDLSSKLTTYEIPDNLVDKVHLKSGEPMNVEESYKLLHKDYSEPYKKMFSDHLRGKVDEVRIEHLNYMEDGKETWFETRAKAVFENGKAIRISGLIENIDAKKLLESKVEEAQQLVSNAINNIEAGILYWDKDDKLAHSNNYMETIFGEALEVGQTFREGSRLFITSGILDLSDEEFEKWLDNREQERNAITGTEINYLPPTKEGRMLQISSRRLPDKSLIQIFSDITDLKQRELDLETTVDKLNVAKEQADGANKAKSQFLANMSHELRTPLNAVIGLTEMLKEDAEDDGNEDYLEPLERIHGASKHLLNLINDVLDLSKIEAGKVELYNESFSLPALLEEVADTSRTLVEQNNNKLILNLGESINFVNADVTRTKQIVLNLISNAAKFCENGEIIIDAQTKKFGKKKLIQIDVKDTGIGMSKEQIDKLFHAFTQADASTTRKYGGTGLGLTIVQNLAKLMGGDVSVKSKIGEGTIFTVSFEDIKIEKPADMQAEDLEMLNRQTALVSKKDGKSTILVIDDDPTIRDLMTRHLEKNNFSVLQALDGAQGIKMAREYKPDAITLDILMPEMDGWSVLRTLKADKQVSHIPVVMASIIDEKKKGFSLGAADYLSKPVERDRLIASISKLLGSKSGQVIMIVEDNEDLRFTIKEALLSADYIVLEAGNGKEAMDILNDRTYQDPDLILLDLMMPEMNGFEFLESYRREFKKQAPIVVITGADLDENDKKFLSSETTRVLEKSSMSDTGIADQLVQTIASVARGSYD